MGLYDRDYYREDYAEKNGLRYDRFSRTYRKPYVFNPMRKGRASKPPSRLSILVKILVWVALLALLHATFRRLNLP